MIYSVFEHATVNYNLVHRHTRSLTPKWGIPAVSRRAKLIYLVSEDWYFWSHRVNLARAARDAGYDVVVVTRLGSHDAMIRNEGFGLIPLDIARGGLNPLRDLRTLYQIWRIYRREQPALVHHVALKPVIYGSIAANLCGIQAVVNAFAGLGFVFTGNSLRARTLRTGIVRAIRALLGGHGRKVIVQNPDDLALLMNERLASPDNVVLIRGSGVDVQRFTPSPEPDGLPLVILPARMLWDKGVREFVAAARAVRVRGIAARFALIGAVDNENPATISEQQLRVWQSEGNVEWWGHVSDMASVYSKSHIVCLPSYREGLPKTLLEGAACARPLVATDVPGCREIVKNGENGLLVPAKNSEQLTDALCQLISDQALRAKMGAAGRTMVEREFSDKLVIDATLEVYDSLVSCSAAPAVTSS